MKSLYAWVCRLEAAVAGVFLVIMVILIFTGAVARMLHYPLNWTGDIATCLFAWACFLCADVAWRKNGLMSFDLITGRLPASWRRGVELVNLALIAVFLVFLAVAGLYLSYVSSARTFQGIPGVSYSVVTMSLPVGALLLLVTTMIKVRTLCRAPAIVSGAAV
ncbi:MAG: TRAP transporter small permease subunit [Candidatus Competibacteraceae bacterium]|nr:TRAP transporter small permease subunit [Candidatus Competibacteraceae bacterium]